MSHTLRRPFAWIALSVFVIGGQLPLLAERHVGGGDDPVCQDLPLGVHPVSQVEQPLPAPGGHCPLCHWLSTARGTDPQAVVEVAVPLRRATPSVSVSTLGLPRLVPSTLSSPRAPPL